MPMVPESGDIGGGSDFIAKSGAPDDVFRFWVAGDTVPRFALDPANPPFRNVLPTGGGPGLAGSTRTSAASAVGSITVVSDGANWFVTALTGTWT